MSNLNTIANQFDFLSFIRDEAMENGNLSIRGVARCCGVHHSSIIKGGGIVPQKLAQTLMAHGFQAGGLLEEGFNAQATWLTLEYFAYDSKAAAPMAKQLARTFGAIGIMATIDQLKNPTPQPVARIQPSLIEYQEAIARLPQITNPILRAALEQRYAEELGATNPLLGGNLVLVSVLARDLGYQFQPREDIELGKYIRVRHKPAGKVQHGRYQVNAYDRAEIINSVHRFFA